MKKVCFALLLSFFTPAFAEPPTEAQYGELRKLADSGAVTDTDLEKFLASKGQPEDDEPVFAMVGTYKVTVDCDLERAIAAGGYDMVHGEIVSSCPSKSGCTYVSTRTGEATIAKILSKPSCKAGKAEVYLVSYNHQMATTEIVSELDLKGLRPATLPELLAFGAARPDFQREFNIVALGSRFSNPDGNVNVPILEYGNVTPRLGGRILNLGIGAPKEPWNTCFTCKPANELVVLYRFLAVRK